VLRNVAGQMEKLQKLLMKRRFTDEHYATLNVNKAGAFLEAGDVKEYMRRANGTNRVCNKCRTFYRGITGKTQHQRTQKCHRLTQIRNLQRQNNYSRTMASRIPLNIILTSNKAKQNSSGHH